VNGKPPDGSAVDPQCRSDLAALAHALGLGAQLPEPSLKQTLSRVSEYSCFNRWGRDRKLAAALAELAEAEATYAGPMPIRFRHTTRV